MVKRGRITAPMKFRSGLRLEWSAAGTSLTEHGVHLRWTRAGCRVQISTDLPGRAVCDADVLMKWR